jgi:RNA recognition motif-containing protein
MKKLFVGNLSWKTTEDDLKNHFEKVGEVVSVRIIIDQYTGKSKGFGFVEMENAEAAQKAISEYNDKPFMERNIRVSIAQERQERSGGGGGGGSGGGDRGGRSGGGGGGYRGSDSRDSRDSRGSGSRQRAY